MKPDKWGPYFWGALHLAALGCPDAQVLRTFIECYKTVLPCLTCRSHFTRVLDENPVPDSPDPYEIFKWSFEYVLNVCEPLICGHFIYRG